MTNTKGKITLFICLVLSFVIMFVLSSCGNTETPPNDSTSNTETSTDSNVDLGTDDSSTNTDNTTPDIPHVHTHSKFIPAKSPTCTEAGLTEGEKCSDCGEVLVEQEAIPATGHVYENGCCKFCNEPKPSEGLEYTLSEDETYYILAGIGDCKDINIVVPAIYKDLPVKKIEHRAFSGNQTITSIKIPDSVVSIEENAFSMCTNLIEKKNGVSYVDDWAIGFDSSVKDVVLKEKTRGIADVAFCSTSLQSIYIPHGVKYIGKSAFAYCSELVSLEIPDTVVSIMNFAFAHCNSITSITIPNSVTFIGERLFYNSTSIKAVILGNGVDSIKNEMFYGCTSLETIAMGNSIKTIEDYAFYSCKALQSIVIPNGVSLLGYSSFAFCSSLKSISIPDSVTTIQGRCFASCLALNEVSLSNGLNYIESESFYNCVSLEKITIPKNVTFIGQNTFHFCQDITSIAFENTSDWIVTTNKDSSCGNTVDVTSTTQNVTYLTNTYKIYYWYYTPKGSEGPVPHDLETIDGKEATCTETGLTEGKKCSICGEVLVEQEIVDKIEHNFENKICTVCGKISPSEGLTYELNKATNTYMVTGIGNCTDTNIIISDTHKGLPVTGTKAYAFSGCKSLTSVTIPDSVTSIGDYAFNGCTSLTSVTIPNSVKSIGEGAFRDCKNLTSVTIPNSVTSIGEGAFGCNKLVEVYNLSSLNITVGSRNNGYVGYNAKVIHTSLDEESILEIVNDYVFMTWEGRYYLMGYIGNETELALPESYNGNNYETYQCAFYQRIDITKVTIGNSVTSIGDDAFRDCKNLTSVTIPNSVTSIGNSAFFGCNKLVEVYNLSSRYITVGSSNNGYVGYNAKVIHTSLDEESILEIVNDYIFMTWEGRYYLMGYIGNETELALPESYNGNNYEIHQCAFYQRIDITKVTIGNSVTSIGNSAFFGCKNLTSVTIPNSITSIGKDAFYSCTGLTSVYISDIESWCNISFGSGTANPLCCAKNLYLNGDLVTNLVVPDTVTEIKAYAFFGCKNLTSVTIPNSITSIGKDAFYSCTGLTSVYISDIESWCNISFGSGTANPLCCAKNLYLNGDLVTNLVVPDTVTEIKAYAFYSCTSLTSVTLPNSVTSIGKEAFFGCTGLTSVYISDIESWCNISFGSGTANPLCYAKNLYLNGDLVTNLVVPDTVTEIKAYAFYDCKNLTSVTIPNSVTSIGEEAFYRCTGLTSVTIPNSITSIGKDAFYSCTGLTSITIPNSVTSIGSGAFTNCTGLTSITIPNSVTSIGDDAFFGCNKLVEVYDLSSRYITVGSSDNGYVGGNAIIVHRSLEEESILKTVDDYIFMTWEGRYYLMGYIGNETELALPESYNGNNYQIYEYAFYYRDDITKVIIPNSVVYIGGYAFSGCTSLKIYCEATSKPSDWSSYWNGSSRPVVWGHTHTYENGKCVCGKTE